MDFQPQSSESGALFMQCVDVSSSLAILPTVTTLLRRAGACSGKLVTTVPPFPLAFQPRFSSRGSTPWLVGHILRMSSPLRKLDRFWRAKPHRNYVQCPPGFLLRPVTSLHWPGVHHYYGFICTQHPIALPCVSTCSAYPSSWEDTGLPWLSLPA